jgi:UPF0755 protein
MTVQKDKPARFFKLHKKPLLLGGACFILLLLLSTFLWVYQGLEPVDQEGRNQIFVVEEGATLNRVAADLEAAHLIRSSTLFRLASRFMENDHLIKTGEYRLSSAMPPLKILDNLQKGRIITYAITIPEGFNLYQIAELFAQKGMADKEAFIERATDKSSVQRFGLVGDTLEGYLYPDTYRFRRNEKVERIIAVMVKRFRDVVAPLEEQIEDSNMTLEQVIILASMVEKETGHPEERPMIARVFLNRLAKKMRLESDPTVIYGMDNFNGNLTKRDLRTKTPYNTYVIPGLPPGPIANPGLAAIDAVLNPVKSDDYYFVSKNNGTHYFSETLPEHNRAVRRFQKKRTKRDR